MPKPEFCYCSKDVKCSNCIRFEAVRKRCLYCKSREAQLF